MILAWGVLVENPALFAGSRWITDGRDEGHRWWSYTREVAERHAAELQSNPHLAPGVKFRAAEIR